MVVIEHFLYNKELNYNYRTWILEVTFPLHIISISNNVRLCVFKMASMAYNFWCLIEGLKDLSSLELNPWFFSINFPMNIVDTYSN